MQQEIREAGSIVENYYRRLRRTMSLHLIKDLYVFGFERMVRGTFGVWSRNRKLEVHVVARVLTLHHCYMFF